MAEHEEGRDGVRNDIASQMDRGRNDTPQADGAGVRCNRRTTYAHRSTSGRAIVPIPKGVTFPPAYATSRQACHKAFRKAIAREPSLAVEELRKLDNARSKEMFMSLRLGIRKGNPRAAEVAIKLLDHAAQINSYAAPHRHELTYTSKRRRGGLTDAAYQKIRNALLGIDEYE